MLLSKTMQLLASYYKIKLFIKIKGKVYK